MTDTEAESCIEEWRTEYSNGTLPDWKRGVIEQMIPGWTWKKHRHSEMPDEDLNVLYSRVAKDLEALYLQAERNGDTDNLARTLFLALSRAADERGILIYMVGLSSRAQEQIQKAEKTPTARTRKTRESCR